MIVTVLVTLLFSIVSFICGFVLASVQLNRAWTQTAQQINLYWTQQMQTVVATFMREEEAAKSGDEDVQSSKN